jgi:hypothetical protein
MISEIKRCRYGPLRDDEPHRFPSHTVVILKVWGQRERGPGLPHLT